jgi:hypothetical protein
MASEAPVTIPGALPEQDAVVYQHLPQAFRSNCTVQFNNGDSLQLSLET